MVSPTVFVNYIASRTSAGRRTSIDKMPDARYVRHFIFL